MQRGALKLRGFVWEIYSNMFFFIVNSSGACELSHGTNILEFIIYHGYYWDPSAVDVGN